MKILSRKIKHEFNNIKLSTSEKKEMLKTINLYMAENPAIKQVFSFQLLLTKNYMIPVVIIALLLATSGGTVAAAENSLPGDLLYSVKLNVNERVMSATAFSDEAKADFEAKLSERRLQEYNKMLENKKWTEEKEKQLTEKLASYQEKTLALIERLRAAGKTELAYDIYDRMVARANSFEEFVDMVKKSNAEGTPTQFNDRVRELKDELKNKDENIGPEGLKVSAEKHIRNAQAAIAKLSEVYDAQKATMADRLKTYIENEMAKANTELSKAQDAMGQEAFKDASESAKQAMQIAIKARNFVNMIENADGKMEDKKLEKLEEIKSWGEGYEVRVQNMIDKAESYIAKLRSDLIAKEASLKPELVTEIKDKLAEADKLITRSKIELANKNYQEAAQSAKEAFEKLLEVRFNEAEKVETDLCTRSNNAIEKATAMLERVRTDANAKMAEWSPAFAERVKNQLDEADALLVKAKAAYTAEKFEEALGTAKETIGKVMEIKLTEIKREVKKILPAWDDSKVRDGENKERERIEKVEDVEKSE